MLNNFTRFTRALFLHLTLTPTGTGFNAAHSHRDQPHQVHSRTHYPQPINAPLKSSAKPSTSSILQPSTQAPQFPTPHEAEHSCRSFVSIFVRSVALRILILSAIVNATADFLTSAVPCSQTVPLVFSVIQ
ncbi:hypothetical protein F4604DRAFT_200145 [Suillus subluteus]|nr:hypothetical protein F4604DRAFT_200145 [Suillus subluteus]